MTNKRDGGRVRRVGEPVQAYLASADHHRLLTLAEQLGVSKSDVLRRGLLALERELTDSASHPALRLIGVVDDDAGRAPDGSDSARSHDEILASGHQRPRRK